MRKYFIISIALISFLASGIANSELTLSADTNILSQKSQMEDFVHDYIMQHPEVILQSLQLYQQQQALQAMEKTQTLAAKNADLLFRQPNDPVIGNEKGKVTLVEFLDYQCPHCIVMTPIINNLIKTHPDLRVVIKNLPVRGPISLFAAKAALAAQKQGKYDEFYTALMESKKEPLTEDIIFELAKSHGLNVDKLKADMNDSTIAEQIKNNTQLANTLGIQGTPVFFIAKTNVTKDADQNSIVFIPGETTQSQLEDKIQKVISK